MHFKSVCKDPALATRRAIMMHRMHFFIFLIRLCLQLVQFSPELGRIQSCLFFDAQMNLKNFLRKFNCKFKYKFKKRHKKEVRKNKLQFENISSTKSELSFGKSLQKDSVISTNNLSRIILSFMSQFILSLCLVSKKENLKLFAVTSILVLNLSCINCQSQSELPELIEKTTSVSPNKLVYIVEDYLVMNVKIPLKEMTSILDDLSFKLENLQYSNEFENVRPRTVLAVKKEKDYYGQLKDVSVKLTIFSRVLSIADGSTLCQKLGLSQLSLENIPYSCDETILLNFELRIENSKIICSAAERLLRDDNCLNYILQKTTSREFMRTKTELTKVLLKNEGYKLYLVATKKNFYFTKSSYGTIGCLGEMNVQYKNNLQSLHSQYFFSLGNLYLNIFSALKSYTAVLSESIHVLSDENYVLPTNIAKPEILIQNIIELLPKKLANLDFTPGVEPDFERNFKNVVSVSNDDIIEKFLDKSFLLEFQLRQLKQIYSAAEQFDLNVKYRMAKFFMNFVDRNFYKAIPNTLLFSRDQNPVTFISLIRSLVPIADPHILHDSFIIIQNCKTKLLNELKKFQTKNINAAYITYFKMSQNKKPSNRTKIQSYDRYDLKSISSTAANPLLRDELINPENFVFESQMQIPEGSGADILSEASNQVENVPVLPQPTQRTSNLVTQSTRRRLSSEMTEEELEYYRNSDPGPDPARQDRGPRLSPSSSSISENLPQSQNELSENELNVIRDPNNEPDLSRQTSGQNVNLGIQNSVQLRQKRGILSKVKLRHKRSGFFTNVFGLATSDDVVELFKSETALHYREDVIEKQVSNLTDISNVLVQSYKNLSADIHATLKREKHLFKTIEDITKAETSTVQTLETLASTIDRLIVVGAEYSSLNMQILLYIHTLEKSHSLVLSALGNVVDIARIPIEILSSSFSDYLKPAIQSITADFMYDKNGYSIKYRIPKLSDPFKIYIINSIPVHYKKLWLKLNTEKYIVINSVADYLVLDEIEKICTLRNDHYLCSPNDVTIRHSSTNCAIEIVQAWLGNEKTYPSCKFENILTNPNSQYSIVSNTSLTISSSFEDRIEYICTDPNQKRNELVPIGLKIFPLIKGCIYETSALTMYNPPRIEYSNFQTGVSEELKLARALSSIDSLLDDVLDVDQANVSNIERLLQVLDEEENEFSVSIDRIKNDLIYEKELKTAQVFNPVKVDLEMPFHRNNAVTGIFWFCFVLFILVTIGCCYKMCPCICPNTCKALKLSTQGYWEMANNCNCCKKNTNSENSAENLDIELEEVANRPSDPSDENNPFLGNPEASAPPVSFRKPSRPLPEAPTSSINMSTSELISLTKKVYPQLTEDIYSTENPSHEWVIGKGEYGELQMMSHVPTSQGGSVKVVFNIIESEVVDELDRPLRYVKKPSDTLINEYKYRLSIAPPPPSFTDKDGSIRLLSNFAVLFDKLSNNWIDSTKKKIILGFTKPLLP